MFLAQRQVKKTVFSGKKNVGILFLQIPKELTFCEDLILRIWPKIREIRKN